MVGFFLLFCGYHVYECSCGYHNLNVYCLVVLMASIATTYGYQGYRYPVYHCFRDYHGWFFTVLWFPWLEWLPLLVSMATSVLVVTMVGVATILYHGEHGYHGYQCSCGYRSWNGCCLFLVASIATTYGCHGYQCSCGYHGWHGYCLVVPWLAWLPLLVWLQCLAGYQYTRGNWSPRLLSLPLTTIAISAINFYREIRANAMGTGGGLL